MFCEKCGKEISDDSLFCSECGAKQDVKPVETVNSDKETSTSTDKYCTNCGSKIPSDSRFCPMCSAKQDDVAPVSEIQPQEAPPQPQAEQPRPQEAPPQPQAEQPRPQAAQPQSQAAQPQPQAEPVMAQSSKGQAQVKKGNKAIGIVGVIVALCVIIGALSVFVKPAINLNKYLKVSFEGYNTVGKAVVSFDAEKFERDYEKKFRKKMDVDDVDSVSREFLSDCVEGDLDKISGLSNGDKVTYTWSCNDEEALKTYGYKLKYKNVEYTISNLKEAKTFDPFDGIDVVFSGVSPNGTASVEGESNAEAAEDLSFSLDVYDNLSNDDTVTVTVTMDDEDPVEYCIENYGMVPSPLTKTYTVEGLDSYIRKTSEISKESIKNMQKQAEDVYKAGVAQNWSDDEKLMSFTYLGTYLLTNKNSENNGGHDNILYLVYNAKVKDTYSNDDEKYSKINDIYWYIAYYDLLVNTDGVTTVEITNYDTSNDSFTIDSGISSGWWSTKSWYYYGYQTLDELYKVVVTSNLEFYDHEDNVDKSNASAKTEETREKTDEKADKTGEKADATKNKVDKTVTKGKGIIFPNSSKQLLNKKAVKKLSDKDLQSAINELYARNGYIFKDAKLRKYYGQFSWYKKRVKPENFTLSLLNKIEKQNLSMLQKERDRRK